MLKQCIIVHCLTITIYAVRIVVFLGNRRMPSHVVVTSLVEYGGLSFSQVIYSALANEKKRVSFSSSNVCVHVCLK